MKTSYKSGFALPTVLLLSLTVIIVVTASLQTISSRNTDTRIEYYLKVAEEAAEAGAAYAGACLEKNTYTQSWGVAAGNKPNLGPATDCSGVAGVYPANLYVLNTPTLRTTFEVGELDTASAYAAQISSTGVAQILNSSGTVSREYRVNIKKVVVWDPNYESQMSSSGSGRTCGLVSSSAYCWGTNQYGQLGNGKAGMTSGGPNTEDTVVPARVQRLAYSATDDANSGIGAYPVTFLASGGMFNCIIIDIGDATKNEVFCWGTNFYGQLGINNPSLSFVSTPRRVPGLAGKKIVAIGTSINTTCAVEANGNLYCWGGNYTGAVGDNTNVHRSTPQLVGGPGVSVAGNDLSGKIITKITTQAFGAHFCAIAYPSTGTVADSDAYCWGANYNGQLGLGTSGVSTNTTDAGNIYRQPKMVNLAGRTVTDVAAEGTSAYDANGIRWHRNINDSLEVQGHAHTCVVANTQVFCWGSNSFGQLGMGSAGLWADGAGPDRKWIYPSPQQVLTAAGSQLNNQTVTSVGAQGTGSCVTAYPNYTSVDDQRAYCWGEGLTLGIGSTVRSKAPVRVDDKPSDNTGIFDLNKVDYVIGGAGRACARVNKKSYCWGSNMYGQIGDGSSGVGTKLIPTEALFLRPLNNQYLF